MTINTSSVAEVISQIHRIAGDDWYWYIDPATNEFNFKQYDYTTVDHHIAFDREVVGLKSSKTTDTATNAIYFTGGDTGGGTNLFYKFTNTANKALQANLPISTEITRPEITDATTAENESSAYLSIGAEISITDDITIAGDAVSENGYPIGSIELGQTLYIQNSGTRGLPRLDTFELDVDRLDYDISDVGTQLSAVRAITYTPEVAKVTRGRTNKTIEDVTRENTQKLTKLFVKDNPTAPS
jgi:hypothetical protein